MQTLFRRAMLGVLILYPTLAIAQQYGQPISANYGRVKGTGLLPSFTSRLALNEGEALPSPSDTLTIGSGLEDASSGIDLGKPMDIPQQGTVNLGTPSYSSGGCSTCGDGSCGGCDGSIIMDTGDPHGGWFSGLYYLVLFRDDDLRGTVLGFDDTDPDTPLLTTGTAHMKEASGFAVRVGKMLNACTAVEGIYWQVFPDDVTGQLFTATTPGNVNSALAFTGLDYDNGDGGGAQPVDNFFTAAQLLEARRTYDYRNVELNFLRMPYVYGGPNSMSRLALLAGARYFRGAESFTFAADLLDANFGNDPANELLYDIQVENHLVGFQLGALLDVNVTQRITGQINSKFGIYNNHMNIDQAVFAGNGGATINDPGGPFDGQPFAVVSEKDDVAFLAELDAGLAYTYGCNWRFTGGYRVLAVSGYADAISQISRDFTDLSSAAFIQDHDSLVLHGAYGGIEYTW